MKILVFSDSHHDINGMIYAVESETPQIIIHLGDNVRDAKLMQDFFPKIKVVSVGGNCDFEVVESEMSFKIKNTKLFITHGHKYRVKKNTNKLISKGIENKADIILFGHTHRSYIENQNGFWLINPGSISTRYTRDRKASYAKIHISEEVVNCEIIQN